MEALQDALKKYPSSFDVADSIKTVSHGELIKIKDKLLIELCSTIGQFSTCMEKTRVWNLLSFIYFILGDRENAILYNAKALQESPDNIIALANGAWFSLKEKKNVRICEETFKRLKSLKGNRLEFLIAKSETAFTYSRFGLKQYPNAISIFVEVNEEIAQLTGNEENVGKCPFGVDVTKRCDIPVEFVCIWTYGYAMTLQRMLHFDGIDEQDKTDEIRKQYKIVFDLYSHIVTLTVDSECIRRYQARSYVQAGLLAYSVNRNRFIFPEGMKGLLSTNSLIFMSTERYFETALQIFPDDVFVLERSGKYFRYIDEIEISIRLLDKAVQIRGTSFGYHHLALSYIRMLEYGPKKMKHLLDRLENQANEPVSRLTFASFNQAPLRKEQSDFNRTFTSACFTSTNKTTFLNPEAKPFIPKTHVEKSRTYFSQSYEDGLKENNENAQAYKTFRTYFPKQTGKVVNRKRNELDNVEKVRVPMMSVTPRKNALDKNGTEARYISTNDFKIAHSPRPKMSQSTRFTLKQDVCRPTLACALKCPLKQKAFDYKEHKDLIDIVLSHLDTAARLACNTQAIYDKALLYRRIQQSENALESLKPLLQNKDDRCSSTLLANAYEQAAFCINDMLENRDIKDGQLIQDLIKDRDFYLKSSVEMSCKIVDKHPYLDHVWNSSSTLRHILLSKLKFERTKEDLRDLWNLYKKINKNVEAIGVLEELKALAEDDAEKVEIIEEIVTRYLSLKKYEEAVIALCMISPLDKGVPNIDKDLYIRVYIESGIEAYKEKHFEIAKTRIRKAFDALQKRSIGSADQISASADGTGERYDLFILSNLEDEDSARNLMMLLNDMGLLTTFNADSISIRPGTSEVQGMNRIMSVSNAFLIMMNFDEDNKKMQHLIDLIIETTVENRKLDSQIILIKDSTSELTPTSRLASFKRLTFDIEFISEKYLGEDDLQGMIKTLLLALTLT